MNVGTGQLVPVCVWTLVLAVSYINLKASHFALPRTRRPSQAHLAQAQHLAIVVAAIWHHIIKCAYVVGQVCRADLGNEFVRNL